MRKPATGEPYAGEPLVRFGGRGGQKAFPTPISLLKSRSAFAMRLRHATAGTGSAVIDLIFSIAKREVTFFSGTVAISFL